MNRSRSVSAHPDIVERRAAAIEFVRLTLISAAFLLGSYFLVREVLSIAVAQGWAA